MQQNAFGCYFCPPLSSSTNNMLTKGKKNLCLVSLLMFKLKAHRQGRAASMQLEQMSGFKSAVWEEKAMVHAYLPRRNPLF